MDRELDPGFRRRRNVRRAGIAVAAVGLAVAAVALASSRLRPSLDRGAIRVGRVERGRIEATVRASGRVIPAHERVLSSPIDARVLRVLRSPGDLLAPGDAILELDTSAARLELAKLDERLAQNENARRRNEAASDEALADLRSELAAQRLELEIADYRVAQHRRLFDDGLVSEDRLREVEVALEQDRIELQRLEQRVEARRRDRRIEGERLELEGRILEREREDVAQRLQLATTSIDEGGVLAWAVEQAGTMVGRGELLARIADLGSFRVEATVSDAYASRLSPGQPVRVEFDDESLAGEIATIFPQIENGALKFVVELAEPSHAELRYNLRVDALVVTGRRDETLVVPRGPFVRGGAERQQVFVVHGDRAERRDVRLGLAGHRKLELIEGAAEGEEIIISDVSRVIHAKEIRIRGRSGS
jgi:HlyD family secretion protein